MFTLKIDLLTPRRRDLISPVRFWRLIIVEQLAKPDSCTELNCLIDEVTTEQYNHRPDTSSPCFSEFSSDRLSKSIEIASAVRTNDLEMF